VIEAFPLDVAQLWIAGTAVLLVLRLLLVELVLLPETSSSVQITVAVARGGGRGGGVVASYSRGLRPSGAPSEAGRGRCGSRRRGSRSLSGELHPFLLLPLIAKPNAHHVLLQVELLRDGGDFLAGRPRLHREVGLQRALFGRRDARALAFLFARRENASRAVGIAFRRFGLVEPGGQDRLEGDHVIVAESEALESADGALRKGAHSGKLEVSQGLAHV